MSSKRDRNKRAKNVLNLDSEKAPSLAQKIIDEINIIPCGRQLERTPPTKSKINTTHQANKPDGSPTSEQVVKEEPCAQEISQDISCNGSNDVHQHPVKDERKSIRRSSLTVASATPGNPDSEIFIQGMQGYQWTDTDLEFVNQTKRKKQVQKIQQELKEAQATLKRMMQTQDLALAKQDKIQTDLSKMLSRERIQEMLVMCQSSCQLEELDYKALLAKVEVGDVLCTASKEKAEVSKLKREVEQAQAMREKEEQLTKDIETCEKNINQIKTTVSTLSAEIAALEAQLSDKEEAPQSAKQRQKVNKGPKPSAPPKPLKPPAALKPKPSKPSSAPPAHKASKSPTAAPAPKPSKPAAPKPSKAPPSAPGPAPKPSKPPPAAPAPKPSKPPPAAPAPKPSKPPPAAPAPKPSKLPATLKDSKAAKVSKPAIGPKAPEGDVEVVRRSKRIAAMKEKNHL